MYCCDFSSTAIDLVRVREKVITKSKSLGKRKIKKGGEKKDGGFVGFYLFLFF